MPFKKSFLLLTALAFTLAAAVPAFADDDPSEVAQKVQKQKKEESLKPQGKKGFSKVDAPEVIATVIELSDYPSWKYNLDNKTKKYLTQKAQEIKESGYSQITVTGHTDNEGDFISNKRLSFKRADIVAKFLVKQGLDEKKIRVRSAAYEKPKEKNTSEKGRSHNRRVVIEIK